MREIYRVVKPGGGLRFFEHVRAGTPRLARVQRLVTATVWPTLNGGCHADRDTAAAIEHAGFTIQRLDRFAFPDTRIILPTSPHILGTALRPGEADVIVGSQEALAHADHVFGEAKTDG